MNATDGMSFGALDWAVLACYLAVVLGIGLLCGRRGGGGEEFFLAGRKIPAWAAACSVVATAISAATFLGAPEQSYRHDLSYLSSKVGELLAMLLVAWLFLPAFYRRGVTSVYELLAQEYGTVAHRAASGAFMVGRVFADGARLFIVGIPFALVAFGTAEPPLVAVSVVALAAATALYTVVGGMRAVIWTDVLQAVVFVGSVGAALWVLLSRIPLGGAELVAALHSPGTGGSSKLAVLDFSVDPARSFTLWTALSGWMLLNLAAFGADQDLAQRMLTCRSARSAQWSAILSQAISWPVVAMFLVIGLLLHVFYQRPDLLGAAAPAYPVEDSRKVFLEYILHEMRPGLSGLMLAGLFAAAMSTLSSALNAMSATAVSDFYRPWRAARGRAPDAAMEKRAARVAVVGWAAILAGFACWCTFWQRAGGRTLIDFALGVMVYAYSGLLAVFLAALLTRRGNAASAAAALFTGFLAVVLLQFVEVNGRGEPLATPWQMVIATALSFAVCCAGRRVRRAAPAPAGLEGRAAVPAPR